MLCKKCGKEIKEGNNFCTNCGKPVNNNHKKIADKIEIKSDNIIKRNLKIIIPIIVIILIATIVFAILNINDNEEIESNTNNEIETEEIESSNDIEIGVEYKCITTGIVGFIKFNTDKDFIMQTGAENSELFTKTGTYLEKEKHIELIVNYNDELDRDNTEESREIPYNEEIKILDNGDLEYVNEYNVTLTFSKNENNILEETSSENLLDEIYAKYPKLKDTEGIICTDGESYWLLDENGEKVYFDSMESFEQAKEKCNINVEAVEKNKDIEINEETTTTTAPQESLSETGSTGSQNNNYNSQDNNNNYLDEMPSQWSADVEINSTDACFNYNGQKCYVKNFGNDIANANYFCYLQDPSTLSNYDLDKTMSKGKGVKYYINGNYIGDSSSKSFNYTFNKNQSVTVKVVASYIFDFATRKTIATNATVYEKTDTAENFYKKSHGTTVSISLPSIWD